MSDPALQSSFGDILSAAQIDTLGMAAVSRSFPRNAVIVTEGDETQALYIIISGRVKVYVSDEEGREVTLRELGPGEYFGEMVLDEGPRSASVITLEPSRFLVVPKAELLTFIGRQPAFAAHLMRTLIRRTRLLTQNVKNLALLDVYGRVARTLLDLAEDRGGDLVITRRPTQQDLANRVGASREMVSKIMKDLSAGGYVRVERDRMVIARTLPHRW